MIAARSFSIISGIIILLVSGLLSLVRIQPSEARLVAHSDFWDGSSDIHLRIPGTNYDANLTHHPAHDTQPTWSPDGKWIAFVSDRELTRKGGRAINELYIMRPNGTEVRKIGQSSPATGTRVISWSADSQWLYSRYITRGWWDTFVVHVPDGYSETLRHDTTFTLIAAWSPDENRLAYRTGMDDDLFIAIGQAVPSGASDVMDTEILLNSVDFIDYFVWSTDGQQIAYISHSRTGPLQYSLSLLTLGKGHAQLLYSSPHPFLDLLWAGESIVFLNSDGQSISLSTLQPDTLPHYGLSTTHTVSGQYSRIAWSPQQQSLAWVVFDNHQNTVYRLNLDGSSIQTLYQGTAPIQRVAWSSDGQWIFFGTGYREQTQLFQMRPDGTDLTYLTDTAFDWAIPVSPPINKSWQVCPLMAIGLTLGGLALLPQIRYFIRRTRQLGAR